MSEGEFKKRIAEKFAPLPNMPESLKSLLQTLNDVENKAIFDILDEAHKEFWNEIIRTGSVRSDLVEKWFGLPQNTCNKFSPTFNLACLLSAGHKGNHRHYPYVWADESGIIYGEDEDRRLKNE